MKKHKKKNKNWGICSLCGIPGALKWKYNRDKNRKICEACHLARQCLEEAKQGKPEGYFSQIKKGLKECWDEITVDFWTDTEFRH